MANTKGHMISLVTRLLIVTAVTVSISVVTAILLIQKYGTTWNVVPVVVFAIIVPATLAIAINYLYWHPRYKVHAP
jgi:nicotinamide riboside transporter PnuC